MAFQVRADQSTTKNIRRILNTQIEGAVAALEGDDKDKGVHEARKTMKRIRALLRLVRQPLGKKNYRRENEFYRDVARELSSARDRYVLVKTLDKLVKQNTDDLNLESIKPIRTHLYAEYEALHATFAQQGVTSVIEQLQTAQQRIALLKLDNNGFGDLEDGLRQIYSSGRVEMWRAKKQPSIENFHEWRKNVKYLWHQIELISPIWQPMMNTYAEELHTLADYLGDDHDYAVLRHTLLELPSDVGDGEVIYNLSRLIESERIHLQQQAFCSGANIYTEETHAFVERLQSYWETWQGYDDCFANSA